jgi:hypothetical protein
MRASGGVRGSGVVGLLAVLAVLAVLAAGARTASAAVQPPASDPF